MGTVDISTSMIINRQCTICKETKLLGDFAKNKRMKLGVASWCLSCKKVKNASPAVRAARKAWRKRHADKVKRYTATRDGKRTLAWIMLNSAKGRAKKDGLPFALTEEDIIIPDICPLLKIPLSGAMGNLSPILLHWIELSHTLAMWQVMCGLSHIELTL